MLFRLSIAFVVVRVTLELLGVRASDDPWPLGRADTLSGVVVAVERDDLGARLRLAAPRFGSRALDDDVTARFAILDAPPAVGEVVRFEAELDRARAYHNPSPFPPTEGPLRARGLSTPEPDDTRGVPWHVAVAIGLRANLTFDDPVVTALHRALVLGERAALPPELRWAYQDTGLAHLLAISGFNLAVLGWGVFRLVRRLLLYVPRLGQGGRPNAWAAGLAIAFVGAYTIVILPSDATDRAMLALGLTLGGTVVAREVRGWRTLSMCFLVALAIDPAALMRPGFQLSFAATAALVLAAPTVGRWKAWLEAPGRVRRPWVRALWLAVGALVITDVATFMTTTPLSLAWFGQVTVHGLWLDLVAIPLMSFVVFPLALVAAFTGLDLGASWVGARFDELVQAGASLVRTTSTDTWPLALGMLAAVGALMLIRPGRARLAGALVVLAATLIATLANRHTDGELELVALDVGHGDALALRLPDGTRMLVDTGGARFGEGGSRVLAERVVVPALRTSGLSAIDVLVLTHADRDHTGAAEWIAARVPIGALWIPPCADRAPPVRAVIERVRARGGEVRVIAAQAPIMLGGARVDILAPTPDLLGADGTCPRDNDGSIVLRVEHAGRSILLTGDIEARAEAELVTRVGLGLRSDVLKAPHHGSRTSSTEAFLDAVAPSIVLVSGEADRPPWPPHPAVLARYRERGHAVFLTGEVGAVRVRVSRAGELVLRPP